MRLVALAERGRGGGVKERERERETGGRDGRRGEETRRGEAGSTKKERKRGRAHFQQRLQDQEILDRDVCADISQSTLQNTAFK